MNVYNFPAILFICVNTDAVYQWCYLSKCLNVQSLIEKNNIQYWFSNTKC